MDSGFVHVGFGGVVNAGRVLAIVSPESAPLKRLIQQARDDGRLIDSTFGRRTKALIVFDTGHLLIAALEPRTLLRRVQGDLEPKGERSEG